MKNLLLFLGAFFLTVGVSAQYSVGDKVEDFSLVDIDGQKKSLKSYEDAKGYIVIFTCNHCPYSVAYEDRIIALQKKYAKKGYPVIAINPNDADRVPEDSFEKMKVRAKEKKFNFSYLYDNTQEIAKKFGATRTPHVYVLQKEDNAAVVKYIGAIDDNTKEPKKVSSAYVEKAVDALLKGKKVRTSFTKAIGCSIKWAK